MNVLKAVWVFFHSLIIKLVDTLRKKSKKSFADRFSVLSKRYNAKLDGEKRLLFQKLKEQESKIPLMKKNGSIRIVEVGAGSGCNLEYFPSKCNLLAVDPNPFFEPYYRELLEKYPGINCEEFKVAYGENMDFINDESVDAVVLTAVGCSVDDSQKVYKEIRRILVPGGKFYYMDHILGKPGTWIYYKLKVMAKLGVFPILFDNCHIDRDLDYQVTLAGFSKVEQSKFELNTENMPFIFNFVVPHVAGIATK